MNIKAKTEVVSVTSEVNAERIQWRAVYGGSTNAEDNTYENAHPPLQQSKTGLKTPPRALAINQHGLFHAQIPPSMH